MGAADWMEGFLDEERAAVEQAAGIVPPRAVVEVPELRLPLGNEPPLPMSLVGPLADADPAVRESAEEWKRKAAEWGAANPPGPAADEWNRAAAAWVAANPPEPPGLAAPPPSAEEDAATQLWTGLISSGSSRAEAANVMRPEQLTLLNLGPDGQPLAPALLAPGSSAKGGPGSGPGKDTGGVPPGGGVGGGGGGGFAFKGGLPVIAAQIAKRRGRDEAEVRSILDEASIAANDLIGAERVKADTEATIAENQRPLIAAQLANDLYQQSLEADVAVRHAEDVTRRVSRLDARIASYSSRKIEDFDLGMAGTIGVALGGLAAAIRGDGGPNRVLALVERMIERDIDKQKFEMEKERGLIGIESDRIQTAESLTNSELTRLRVLRAERWARTGRLIEAEAGRYSGILGEAKAAMAIGAIRERAIKERLGAVEAVRGDSLKSFAVQVDALSSYEQLNFRRWEAQQGGGEKRETVPEFIIKGVRDARVGLNKLEALAAAQQKLSWHAMGTQFFIGTYGISYDDFKESMAMEIASALNGGKPTDKDQQIAASKMLPEAGDSDERAQAKLARVRQSLLVAEKETLETALLGGYDTRALLGRFRADEQARPLDQRVTGTGKVLSKEAR